MGVKKHKKHKSERRERHASPNDRPPGLKLILKVGNQSTPEHNTEWPYPGIGASSSSYSVHAGEETLQVGPDGSYFSVPRSHHKKSKKKKKKKDKGKDKERKHRHHHKEKKRKREESSVEDGSLGVNSPGQVLREPRTCVLRQRQERSPLQKMLEHLHKALEKRDPQQFFAWPVTDNIAPGYSAIISQPMDLSTMKQKIDENQYGNLQDFIADFKLMCTNAMEYNHVDTVYYKASKKLLHAGLKLMQPDKLGWLLNLIPELTSQDLGFEITPELRQERAHEDNEESDTSMTPDAKRRMPASKFEAVPDDLTPEEILAQSQAAARDAKAKLSLKRGGPNMGFLRQRKDGSTYLNILIGGDGVIPGTKKRPVLLGALTGKLTEGTSQLQGFREDRRNIAKPVKPLYYGAFGSYAPSYDSAFANLTKEESDLVFQTYGSDAAVQYSESILDFAKDNEYTMSIVDSLLDLLTGGDHSKTKKILEEKKHLREEEEAIKTMLECKQADSVKIDVDELKTLQDVGIDVNFLDGMESEIKMVEDQLEMQQRLNGMCQLLEKLQKTQHNRLSAPLPANLNQIQGASEEEVQLAENITENLTEIAKRVNPSDIAPPSGLRKAMGIAVPEVDVANDVPDLELELRQFLESEPTLSQSPLRDDKTIEEILME